ncbi:hypothetical protein BKD30_02245 [Tersicoccus phoenicis]|uniref:Uncharacterized protein n=1 Tax=Tersicoccus phoenicis TaxID=554083 RepID=A0A1R1LL05_9MICC|nr:hypothetical protein [Tersicoccus phoenicis]OMH28174.1 hypothetical protein BKD30_02245 [Tersicoccus phoenicis]
MSSENHTPDEHLTDAELLRQQVGSTGDTERAGGPDTESPGETVAGTDPDAAATLTNAEQQVGGPTLGRYQGERHSDEPDGGTDPT